jgi:hypothetical protein
MAITVRNSFLDVVRSQFYPLWVRSSYIDGYYEPVFVDLEPRNRFLAWRAGATTLFVVPDRQATWG